MLGTVVAHCVRPRASRLISAAVDNCPPSGVFDRSHVRVVLVVISYHLQERGIKDRSCSRTAILFPAWPFTNILHKPVVRYEDAILSEGFSDIDAGEHTLFFIKIDQRIKTKDSIVFRIGVGLELPKIGRGHVTFERVKHLYNRCRNGYGTRNNLGRVE